VPDAAERIGASHLLVLEQAASAAHTADETERGIAFASAALKEVDATAEPVRAALLLETRATLGKHSGRTDPSVDLRAALELVPPGLDDAARARVLVSEAKCAEPHEPGRMGRRRGGPGPGTAGRSCRDTGQCAV
jgi:hypothetical protein